jgi:DNA-binding transcriptional MerR regulator
MFKIGEFSKLTQVSIRMLRYYDETGLLKPAEIDSFSNYRFYSIEQIPVLNKIVFLRDLGFNVSEITIAINNWNNNFIEKLLEEKRIEIENTIKNDQNKLLKMELAKKDIQHEKMEINYNVLIKPIPSYQVLSLRRIVPNYYAEGQLWKEIAEFAKNYNVLISENTFTIYHDIDYKESDVDIEVCTPVEIMKECKNGFTYRKTETIPTMACMMVYGKFENISGAYIGFANWLKDHNQFKMKGQSRQIVHKGPWNEQNPDNYLTEIQIPLEEI